jgi:hypothetical protein
MPVRPTASGAGVAAVSEGAPAPPPPLFSAIAGLGGGFSTPGLPFAWPPPRLPVVPHLGLQLPGMHLPQQAQHSSTAVDTAHGRGPAGANPAAAAAGVAAGAAAAAAVAAACGVPPPPLMFLGPAAAAAQQHMLQHSGQHHPPPHAPPRSSGGFSGGGTGLSGGPESSHDRGEALTRYRRKRQNRHFDNQVCVCANRLRRLCCAATCSCQSSMCWPASSADSMVGSVRPVPNCVWASCAANRTLTASPLLHPRSATRTGRPAPTSARASRAALPRRTLLQVRLLSGFGACQGQTVLVMSHSFLCLATLCHRSPH